jgi:Zn-dependent protease/CBS domain-containing protein
VEQRTGEQGDAPARRQPGTLRIGQLGGVEVLVRSSWLLVAILIAVLLAPRVEQVHPGLGGFKYVAGVAFAVLLYLSVLLHELSHALMAKRYGLPVRSISLHFLGGVTEIEGEPDTPGREFGVSVVGPLTSIAVGAAFVALWFVTPEGLLQMAVEGLAGANLIVGVLNLVPGLPLDGGRLLRAAVWKLSGNPHRATIVAGWAGRGVAFLVLLWPMLQPLVLDRPPDLFDYLLAFVVAAFLWGGASSAIANARLRRKLPALRARALARRAVAVRHDLPLSEAIRRAQELQAGSIVVVDRHGRPTGIASEAAVLATPDERRPWLPVETVSRTIEPGLMLPADIAGEPMIRAMQRTPAKEYLLLEHDGSVYGVLVSDDVDRAFAAAG